MEMIFIPYLFLSTIIPYLSIFLFSEYLLRKTTVNYQWH